MDERKVLIVDHDRSVADTLALLFAHAGYATKVEYRGDSALTAAAVWQPDLAVLDFILNGQNGLNCADQLRDWYPGCKIILIFSMISESLIHEARKRGYSELFGKPIDPENLLLTANMLMKEQRDTAQVQRERWRRVEKPVETIVVVHGTYPDRSSDPLKPSWWQPRSDFCRVLDAALAKRDLRMRAWKHIGMVGGQQLTPLNELRILDRVTTRPSEVFSWSGMNSELDRRTAAFELVRYIAELEANPAVRTYHLVAHSHGGNVIRRAFRDIRFPIRKAGYAVFLGTPLFTFKDEGRLRNIIRRIHLPLLFTTLLIGVGVIAVAKSFYFRTFISDQDLSHLTVDLYGMGFILLFMMLGGSLVLLERFYHASWSPLRPIRAYNIVFPSDEAIGLLRKCSRILTDTHLFLHGLFANPTDSLRWKEHAITGMARWPIIGGFSKVIATAWLVMFCRPYRPPFRMFFSSRLEVLKEHVTFLKEGVSDKVGPSAELLVAGEMAQLLASLPYILFIPIDCLLGCFDWMLQVLTRLFMWRGVRTVAATAFGIDVLGSAFDFERVAQNIDGVAEITVSREAEDRILSSITKEDETRLRLAEVMREDSIDNLVGSVRRSLEGANLLHSQYYKNPEMIDLIADTFASLQATHHPQSVPRN
jgi:DNA-binding response OmpR family regulator